jgi:hypothetical protein
VAERGFSEPQVEAAIHQLEFSQREVTGDHYPFGLSLLMRLIGPWLHADDPVSPLQIERDLARLRRELAAGPFFENLIDRWLLNNAHRVTLLLKPDAGQKEREEARLRARLEAVAKSLNATQKDELVRRGRELQQAQEAEEDLTCLPVLKRADIPVDEAPVAGRCSRERDVPVYWFDQPTNGIGYFSASLKVDDLPEALLADVPLFCALLTKIGAAGQSYLRIAERITEATGGIQASALVMDSPDSLETFQLTISLRGKALHRNQGRMFDILADLCTAPDFADLKRLHTVLQQLKTSLENSVPGAGHSYASRVAGGALTTAGRFREMWSGLHLIATVKRLAACSPSQLDDLAGRLRQLAGLVFQRQRLSCSVTAESAAFEAVGAGLTRLLERLPAAGAADMDRHLYRPLDGRATGWQAPVPVSYVARVFRAVPFSHEDAAGLMILAKLLRGGYLHREIREKGGAYGGMASYDAQAGLFSMLSYRDPHLLRTLGVYRDAASWAAEGGFTDTDILEAVLGVFGQLDRPLSPGGKGHREFHRYLQGLSTQLRQALRRRLLAVDAGQLADLARRYLVEGWGNSAVAVVAGEDMLQEANRQLGDEALTLHRT